MKLLLDQNLSFKLCQQLADCFPDSRQVRLVGLADAPDRAVWEYAEANGFAWLRCGNQPSAVIAQMLRAQFDVIAAFEADVTAACLEIY